MGKRSAKKMKSGVSSVYRNTKEKMLKECLVQALSYMKILDESLDSTYNSASSLFDVPKPVQVVMDIVYYSFIDSSYLKADLGSWRKDLSASIKAINTASACVNQKYSSILKSLEGIKVNYEEYFSFKYVLNAVVMNRSITGKSMSINATTIAYLSLLHKITVIMDVYFLDVFKQEIVGVDIKTNKLKVKPADMIYRQELGLIRSVQNNKLFEEGVDALLKPYIQLWGRSGDAKLSFYDKVDDMVRNYELRVVMTDIANQKRSKFKFVTPSRSVIHSILVNGEILDSESTMFKYRNCISAREGNLLVNHSNLCEVESLLIKDIEIGGVPYICIGYRLKDGTEDTLIVPIKFDSVVLAQDSFILELALKFYGVDNDDKRVSSAMDLLYSQCEVISPYYWKYRNKHYTSTGDKVLKDGTKVREYKEVIIGMHKAKLGNPSSQAKELARRHCIVLNKGETLVREHIRHYNKDVKQLLEEV